MKESQLNFYYNYLLQAEPEDFGYHLKFLARPDARKALHVGKLDFDEVDNKLSLQLFSIIKTFYIR